MRRSHVLNRPTDSGRFRGALANRYLHAGLVILALVALAGTLVFNRMVMPRYTRAGTAFSMPAVVPLSRAAAVETLLAHGLEHVQWDTVLDFSVPSGTILAQRPLPGAQVKSGRTVYLKQSDDTRDSVRVPELVDRRLSEARSLIRQAKLVVGEVLPDSFPAPYADVVTRQHPPADSIVLRRDSVTIWFSTGLGNRLVEVPAVTGLQLSEAIALLREAGLHARYFRPDSLNADLPVTRQGHPAGNRLAEGSEVWIFREADSSAVQ